MPPTIDEQLAGAQRLLDKIEAGGLPPDTHELAAHVRRLLGHVERSWAGQLSFHLVDNERTVALLASLAPLLDAGPADRLRGLTVSPTLDPRIAAEHNAVLRAHLSEAIAALPSTPAGRSARAAVASHLRQRLESDPTWRETT